MKKYIFNDNTKLIFVKENNILLGSKKRKEKAKLDYSFYEKLYNTKKEISIFKDNGEIFTKKEMNFLINKSIVKEVDEITLKYLKTKYEKFQIYLGNIIENANKVDYIEINKNKRILFIGAGGICTAMIDYLISSGFNKYGIVDFDVVEKSNFNRQYKYKKNDIGSLKVESIKKNLIEQYDDLSIKIYNKKIEIETDLLSIVNDYDPDFIICAADTPAYLINKYIAEVCLLKSIPCIFGGVGQNSGVFGPLLCDKKSFKKYLTRLNFVLSSIKGIFPCKGSFGITNSLIANYMANDVIFYLMKQYKKVHSLNKECTIDFNRNDIYEREKY